MVDAFVNGFRIGLVMTADFLGMLIPAFVGALVFVAFVAVVMYSVLKLLWLI